MTTYSSMIESAGGRVVPVSYKLERKELIQILDNLNGVLFTGGDLTLYNKSTGQFHPYMNTVKTILDYTITQNNLGNKFALFAICQGFQALHILISGDPNVLQDSRRLALNDSFTVFPFSSQSSKFLDFQSQQLTSDLVVEFNWHHFGIPLWTYDRYPALSSFFKVISTDQYPGDSPIVATVEARDYPIFAVQYHPEKTLFVHTNQSIPKSAEARQFAEDIAFGFVDQCRKNR